MKETNQHHPRKKKPKEVGGISTGNNRSPHEKGTNSLREANVARINSRAREKREEEKMRLHSNSSKPKKSKSSVRNHSKKPVANLQNDQGTNTLKEQNLANITAANAKPRKESDKGSTKQTSKGRDASEKTITSSRRRNKNSKESASESVRRHVGYYSRRNLRNNSTSLQNDNEIEDGAVAVPDITPSRRLNRNSKESASESVRRHVGYYSRRNLHNNSTSLQNDNEIEDGAVAVPDITSSRRLNRNSKESASESVRRHVGYYSRRNLRNNSTSLQNDNEIEDGAVAVPDITSSRRLNRNSKESASESVRRHVGYYSRRNLRNNSTSLQNDNEIEDGAVAFTDINEVPGAVAVPGIDGENNDGWSSDFTFNAHSSFRSSGKTLELVQVHNTGEESSSMHTSEPPVDKSKKKRRIGVAMTVVAVLLVAVIIVVVAVQLSSGSDSDTQIRKSMVLRILAEVSNTESIQQDGSPQQLAFDWIVHEDKKFSDDNPEKLKSRYALAVFYFATGGSSSWKSNDRWLNGTECRWIFVTCNLNGNVTKIQARTSETSSGLEGTLPWEDLSILTALETLDVGWNKISGTIDPTVSKFSNLRLLYLNNNELTGSLPEELYNMNTLETLALEDNNFKGAVSNSVGRLSKLAFLRLHNNKFTGNIPETLYDLTSLRLLWLLGNRFTGEIDSAIGNLSMLRELHLADNSFRGSIPASVGGLIDLDFLNIQNNFLSGTIPEKLYELDSLETLVLRNNEFSGILSGSVGSLTNLAFLTLEGNNFTGTIPESLYDLTSLTSLYIANNFFQGKIDSSIGNLIKLNHLGMNHNTLSGRMPTTIGMLTDLRFLDLANNTLNGTIPSDFYKLVALERIVLSRNALMGSLSARIGNLINLETIQVAYNQFSSSIPTEVGLLAHLVLIQLTHNQFTSSIPTEIGLATNLKIIEVDYNQLSSSIPTEIGLLAQLKLIRVSSNQFTSSMPTEVGLLAQLDFFSFFDTNITGVLPEELCGVKFVFCNEDISDKCCTRTVRNNL